MPYSRNLTGCVINGNPFRWGDDVASDDIRCVLTRFFFIIRLARLEYLCFGFLFVIIVISIFGNIKDNYRWLILNQAVWDLILSYGYICNNYMLQIYASKEPTCFYDGYYNYRQVLGFLPQYIFTEAPSNYYSALLLLTLNQALSVYSIRWYLNFIHKKRRTLVVILGANLFFIGTSLIAAIFFILTFTRYDALEAQCKLTKGKCRSPEKEDVMYKAFFAVNLIFYTLDIIKPVICLSISLLSASLVMAQVIKQIRFRLFHRNLNYHGSLRVSVVLMLQCLMNFIVFCLEAPDRVIGFWGTFFSIDFTSKSLSYVSSISSQENIEGFRQIRIFFEGVFLLAFMTGYRESLIKVFQTVHTFLKPRSSVSTILISKLSVT